MIVTARSVRGSGVWNEDALVSEGASRIYGVIDGATSLVPFAGPAGETGGYYASRIVAESVKRTFGQQAGTEGVGTTLQDALAQANRELRNAMEAEGIEPGRKEQLWSAGAVLVRLGGSFIEYAQAGDCMLTAVYRDGTIRVVTHDQIAHLDRVTHRLWAEGIEGGLTSRDALWNHVKPQIIAGRQSANTPEGYAVLNGEPEAVDYLEYGRLNRINLKALLLMTDGLYVPKRADERAFDPVETTELVARLGLDSYLERLIRLEECDPNCRLYPRVKMSDDKTAIWIEL